MAKKKVPVIPKTAEKPVRTKQLRGGTDQRPLHDCPALVRLTKHEKDVVDLAATYESKSTAYFVAEAAVYRAYEVLRQRKRELASEGKLGLA